MNGPQILIRVLARVREFMDMIELDFVFQSDWFVANAATKNVSVVKGAVDQAPRNSHRFKRLALCQFGVWPRFRALPSRNLVEG